MHIHLLQHGPDYGPARLTDWLASMGHSYTVFHLYDGELPPRPGDCDALIVLDGPEALLDAPPTWYKAEDKLINRLLDSQKPLLGIGLGAHYIADALGAISALGIYPETGWHTVSLADESPFELPDTFDAFMWHRYVFSLPDGALPLGGSAAAPLQGFSWDGGRVMGLLCHLEASQAGVKQLIDTQQVPEGRDDYTQADADIFAEPKRFDRLAPLLDRVLSQWLGHA
ncbi:type 1 glutamine amidotransferase [Vreelandella salicampi]|uniref:Type 1 glutamine amidotransferase n=1 Tax=Vreelandella salicampi TaxID=1449798 RepID=A0A7Z0LK92_9GAMM|nr:type 1 glutamine amidotransferase [Halomonas salicampi]NYS60526.1 type 1 glutamine amidotransferase [Halomonas salicampi]